MGRGATPATQAAPTATRRYGAAAGNAAQQQTQQAPGVEQRKELLDHIQGRLDTIKQAQAREMIETAQYDKREHWREIHDSHKAEHVKPDASRWHKATKLYQQATDALARGDLRRGAGLLRMAERAEAEAFEQAPEQVDMRDLERPPPGGNPRTGIAGAPIPSCAVPDQLRGTIHDILHTEHWLDELGAKFLDEREQIPVEEEEEDEDGNKKDGKGS